MRNRTLFPFAAVVGQDDVKEALLIAMVNPKAGGVLISGGAGTAKSTLVRALAAMIPGRRIVELPLNATEDMVFGSLDLEQAVTRGQKAFSSGILSRAHGHVLYVDEINLLRREVLNGVLDAAGRGVNVVEREGMSHRHAAEFTLLGTMNPAEGTLTPQVLDRFGLFAAVRQETDPAVRVEIMRRVLAYEQESQAFCQAYEAETLEWASRLEGARNLVGTISVTLAMMQLAAQYCAKANAAGHRAELFLLEAAKGIAALAGRDYLLPGDLERAAFFVLPHRMRQEAPLPPEAETPPEQNHADENPSPPTEGQQDRDDAGRGDGAERPDDSPESPEPHNDSDGQENTADIDRSFTPLQLDLSLPQDRHARRGSGKRSLTRTDLKQGRYVRACLPTGELTDLAFDATLRAAAPYQKRRPRGVCAISIRQEDLRQKVREKRIGNIFLFVVDASGSMGARQRMGAVKGAVFTMLQDAYQKRDQVGMIAFRRQTAEILLPVTRSIDLAQKCLQALPTGGKTPLAEGLHTALALLQTLMKKDREMRPVLVLVTDGRANSSPAGGDPVAEAIDAAAKIRRIGCPGVVIDTENDFISLALAEKVARSMGAAYYHLQELSHDHIIRIIKTME